ncbi:MAG: hypothetical protein P8J59_06760 [Phycisphaerales bacterium]|nr:hypothetical protein [Phycisphaerales bacterium]
MRHCLSGLVGLLYLGVTTGFRFRGRYWSWRMETALGSDRSIWPSAAERRRSFIAYGAWARRLRLAARER